MKSELHFEMSSYETLLMKGTGKGALNAFIVTTLTLTHHTALKWEVESDAG